MTEISKVTLVGRGVGRYIWYSIRGSSTVIGKAESGTVVLLITEKRIWHSRRDGCSGRLKRKQGSWWYNRSCAYHDFSCDGFPSPVLSVTCFSGVFWIVLSNR